MKIQTHHVPGLGWAWRLVETREENFIVAESKGYWASSDLAIEEAQERRRELELGELQQEAFMEPRWEDIE